jgi:serine protease
MRPARPTASAIAATLITALAAATPAVAKDTNNTTGRLLVQLKPGSGASAGAATAGGASAGGRSGAGVSSAGGRSGNVGVGGASAIASAAAVRAAAARAHAVAAHARAATALTVPQLRLVVVKPSGARAARARDGASTARLRALAARLRALAARLRADPRVASVRLERRFSLRYVPTDPAFTTPERGDNGTTVEWWAAREGLTDAWDVTRGDGARVAVIDTGVDATHPELSGQILATADFDDNADDGPPTVDEEGHGTHVASLACAAADNGQGIAGAGGHCGLLVAKTDLSEGSVARSVVWAADNGAEAINMSFGTDGRFAAAPEIVQALQYANNKGAVLVAAAADQPTTEQGDPANVLQPTNSGSDINQNLGLSITAATAQDRRADFAGRGTQISMAAYGTYGPGGRTGLLGAFPAAKTRLERTHTDPADPLGKPIQPCNCRTTLNGDSRYAYLPGTSMSAPQVAGVAALMRHLNPDLPAADVVRILKQTANRPPDVAWTPELGWGILNAGAALAAARSVDAHPPTSSLMRPKVTGRSILLRWRGVDDTVAGVVASGIDRFEIWRSTPGHAARKIKITRKHSFRIRGRHGGRYSFYTIAVDHAGNREPPPAKADASVRVARR